MVADVHIPVLDDVDPGTALTAVIEHGAAFIKRPGTTLFDFREFTEALMVPMVHHATNTIERDPVGADPSTSTVNKGMDAIPLHREGSYAPGCPDLLVLYCERPAAAGGETVLCDGAELLRRLDESTRAFVSDLDLYWSWEATPARWQQTFGVTDVALARVALARVGGLLRPYERLDGDFQGDVLHGRFRTKAVIPSNGGVPSFCNSLMIYAYRQKSDYYARDSFRVALADGSPFPADLLAEIREVAETVSVRVSWEPGNLAVFDNARFMHGRTGFDDTGRRVLIRMGHLRKR
ncbi:TauD/TfdA family dioxygenase [Parafrankia sp. EUN1f]|uniref:TauD/TfdA family dioxygenase n=1 Tax=Parafrankia sp. EUN1f TaxID=102897 RepID=UPI0001C43D9F|nr:TauD/TfdA family dioxygenase [Parafrankia sp. EUN1f]EFC86025.1 Taurine catabolism dioxygenase TauD/TfdA [Parafrankia sp. EUN1f]